MGVIISTLFSEIVFVLCLLQLSEIIDPIKMITEPKPEVHRIDAVRRKREPRRDEKALDEALNDTFPASDPVSVEQPVLPGAHND
jgi:hypothetical protein